MCCFKFNITEVCRTCGFHYCYYDVSESIVNRKRKAGIV